jgi:hypothetical protein
MCGQIIMWQMQIIYMCGMFIMTFPVYNKMILIIDHEHN